MNTTSRTWLKSGVIGLAGLAAGGVLATTVAATAEDAGSNDNGGQTDARSDEQPLTGATADKVRAAALDEYPGATVVRLETESDGGYEAHLLKADGTPVTVLVDKDFQVTGEQEGGFGHHGDFGGPGGPGGGPGGSGEEALTGDDAAAVREAALAEYPGATVVRIETDSDGIYEAHLLKADGTPVTVEVDADFQVTGEEEGGFGHGFGDRGSDDDGSGDDSTTQSSSDSV